MAGAILRTMAIITTVAVFSALWCRGPLKNWQCAQNLEQIGAALQTYAQHDKSGDYAPMSRTPGCLMFSPKALGSEAMQKAPLLISYVHPHRSVLERRCTNASLYVFDDNSYWYLGFAFANERSANEWLEACKEAAQHREPVNDFEREARHGGSCEWRSKRAISSRLATGRWAGFRASNEIVYAHLKENIGDTLSPFDDGREKEAYFKSIIPVMVERPELHGNGGHVLYLDGHVEFVPYPGQFPMTQKFIEGLRSLDRLPN
ncbi:MAG: hypothetical protein K1Y02_24420 [Candidatus Hydrogenedentes bacterium]|nr:hypothetical protein [Candidatus Hydrogenedentota bacterium]